MYYMTPKPVKINHVNSYGAVNTLPGINAEYYSGKIFMELLRKDPSWLKERSLAEATTKGSHVGSTDIQNSFNSFPDSPWKLDKGMLHNTQYLVSPEVRHFQREWFRQRRHRVDWKSLVRPCMSQMGWGETKPGWGKQNRSNAAASSISFWDVRPAGEYSKFLIQSRTVDGRAKSIGGDWWRVYLRGPASLAATIFDHNNGSYEVLFLLMEPGVYKVEIFLDYSLCDGLRDPPRDWFIKGEFNNSSLFTVKVN